MTKMELISIQSENIAYFDSIIDEIINKVDDIENGINSYILLKEIKESCVQQQESRQARDTWTLDD